MNVVDVRRAIVGEEAGVLFMRGCGSMSPLQLLG
jgi:hypothetical protein